MVDDEPDALKAFEEVFGGTFNVATFSAGEEALESLRATRNPVALVIADQRMPGMKGVELLSKVKVLLPDALRYLVTAYSDVEVLKSAINTGAAHRFIEKPWKPEVLESLITQAVLDGGMSNVPDAVALRDARSSLQAIRLAAAGVLHTGLDELGIHGVIGTQLFVLLSESLDKGREESVEKKLGKLLDLSLGSLELVRSSDGSAEKLDAETFVAVLDAGLKGACSLADRDVRAGIAGLEGLRNLSLVAPRTELQQLVSLFCLMKFTEFPARTDFAFSVSRDAQSISFSMVIENEGRAAIVDERVLEINFAVRLLASRLRVECFESATGPVAGTLAIRRRTPRRRWMLLR